MEIPFEKLNPETINRLAEEFVSREGTDYGAKEWTFHEKVEQLTASLRSGKARITFDPETETCGICLAEH